MAKIEFPHFLKMLLEDSDLRSPIRAFADRVGEILADNKLPFFPDYTDHGTEHIDRVLKSEVDLIPKQVWADCRKDSDPRLLCDADAAVIIGATLLHDIAMHLRLDGFRELIDKDTRFQPLPWFRENHEGHVAEIPWNELWEDFAREARRFSDRDLTNIIGEESARDWKFHGLPQDAGQWDRNHHLIVGEFIRRHHARLAHEIAIYGFPGLPNGPGDSHFPAMGKTEGHALMRLADLIGLTARSHGTSLRLCKAYLEALYPGTPQPMGTAIFYPMALLRVADYLQIDRQRAPAVLLRLRNPQSPVSVREWNKHRAVQHIGPATDPRGTMVTVSTDLNLSLYLQLRDLFVDLQAEMDHSTAVLDEVYGTLSELGLNRLNLSTRRIYSNLQSPPYRDSLPYVPKATGFTADPNLLTLLVEPLYGKEPSVGVRELMQNAADAVRELKVWCEARGKAVESLDLSEQDGDVLIEFIKRDDGSWFLRVCDRGIGMTADTIQNYFLRAGASFRRSSEWAKEFVDDEGHARVARAGRFGIGAFAVFLLGPSFRLRTRHAGAARSGGYAIEASSNSQLIEIRRADGLKIGTTIEAELSPETVEALLLEGEYTRAKGPEKLVDWYCWDWPTVVKRVIRGTQRIDLKQKHAAYIQLEKLPPAWSVIKPKGFDAVFWTFEDEPPISCNGLKIAKPDYSDLGEAGFEWSDDVELTQPVVAVLDSEGNLPVTTQRYELSQDDLPFTGNLTRDVTLCYIAHALVCGPSSPTPAALAAFAHPLEPRQLSHYDERQTYGALKEFTDSCFTDGLLRWCVTATEIVPADPWLYSLLNTKSCVIAGCFSLEGNPRVIDIAWPDVSRIVTPDRAMLLWNGSVSRYRQDSPDIEIICAEMLWQLAHLGVRALGHDVASTQMLISTEPRLDFVDRLSNSRSIPNATRQFRRDDWREASEPGSARRRFAAAQGKTESSTILKTVVDDLEPWLRQMPIWSKRAFGAMLYAAEIETQQTTRPAETLLASVWQECLGARAIPFDVAARGELIAFGSRHPELGPHIAAWEEMKRTNSKWLRPPRSYDDISRL